MLDGTGNEYGTNNTNVVDMYKPVIRDQEQIAYYDPGIGTFSVFGRNLGKTIGIPDGPGSRFWADGKYRRCL
jgi:hypothetical protein